MPARSMFRSRPACRPTRWRGANAIRVIREGHISCCGFTLIELLVVLVIAGAALALVVVQATPNAATRLRDDSQKIARLFTLADEEAQLRAQPLIWEADAQGWRFVIHNGPTATAIQDDVLAPQRWTAPLDALQLAMGTEHIPPRLTFGAETINRPFQLTLIRAGHRATISSDGAGTYTTELDDTP